ncbi:hypothetical protein AB0H42_18275 [Nocardia sp. NPDC050799]|uniref:hypothetical protein n=1 Tax=Nocardia sp. NPDC050799 TaxID=3154842 RepID=UPI0034092865
MGSIGDCFDKAVIESFWDRVQTELLNRQRWRTRKEPAVDDKRPDSMGFVGRQQFTAQHRGDERVQISGGRDHVTAARVP